MDGAFPSMAEPSYLHLPNRRPLPMPAQDLRHWPGARGGRRIVTATAIARLAVVSTTIALTAGLEWGLYQVLSPGPWTISTAVLMLASLICFGWISFGSANAIVGAAKIGLGLPLDTLETAAASITSSRTALLFPIYHEDPSVIAATIEDIGRGLARLGHGSAFDVFVLSDSRTREARQRERAVFSSIDRQLTNTTVYYRNRQENVGKKAGNIADWVESFGAAYDHFIILDADSVMSATLLVHLAGIMERNPAAGLVQTVPQLIGASSVFGRLQQFAQACYGPMLAAGYAAWQGDCGNYWGHNAIIRTRAFAQSAGLPLLPGRPPLGGAIRSHDFVEAALMRRAGWGIHMAPSLEGSFEGCPPTLPDLAIRDRRWAQGNLQHIKVVGAAALAPLSRVHLLLGIVAYLASAFWAAALLAGLLLTYQTQLIVPRYFPTTPTLFPLWPSYNPDAALYLLVATAAVLLLPKLLGIALALGRARRLATRCLLVGGFTLEAIVSMLVAPVMMALQVQAVAETLLGRDSGWAAQSRRGERVSWRAALRFHGWHVGIGLALAAVCFGVSWQVLAWMSPIVLGLALSPALSVWTSRDPDWTAAVLATPANAAAIPYGPAPYAGQQSERLLVGGS